jgi:hypothetical protein
VIVETFIGKRIVRIRRIFYELEGVVERHEGPVELSFADGEMVWFDVGPDGESLAVLNGCWVDHFAPPLSPENEEYIRTHGKYSAFDVGEEAGYRDLVNENIADVRRLVEERRSKIVGLVIIFSVGQLRIEVEADDLYVTLGPRFDALR